MSSHSRSAGATARATPRRSTSPRRWATITPTGRRLPRRGLGYWGSAPVSVADSAARFGSSPARHQIWGGAALVGRIDRPRGPISVFSTILDWPPQASAVRQASIRHLALFASEVGSGRLPPVVCGDFNASPDSDEIRPVPDGRTRIRALRRLGDGRHRSSRPHAGAGQSVGRAAAAAGPADRLHFRWPTSQGRRRPCRPVRRDRQSSGQWSTSIGPLRRRGRPPLLGGRATRSGGPENGGAADD
jgi:endonuclease/exonuclease/phosphatase family protein